VRLVLRISLSSQGDSPHLTAHGFLCCGRTFGVNVLSHFWIIKTFLPAMLASGKPGHIVSCSMFYSRDGHLTPSSFHIMLQMTVASVLGLVGSARMSALTSPSFFPSFLSKDVPSLIRFMFKHHRPLISRLLFL
jgi:hypothetical protein